MKNILTAMACLFFTSLLLAQKKEWAQMESFHKIMSQTFHASEEGNLQPLKDNVDKLISRGKAWQTSGVPAGYNEKAIRPLLNKLVKECVSLKEAVKKKNNDGTLKKMISAAHDTFHQVMEKCEDTAHN